MIGSVVRGLVSVFTGRTLFSRVFAQVCGRERVVLVSDCRGWGPVGQNSDPLDL